MSVAVIKPKPVPEVIEGLRTLLAQAELGDVQAVTYVADMGRHVHCRYLGKLDRIVVLGELARLAHKVNLDIDAGST